MPIFANVKGNASLFASLLVVLADWIISTKGMKERETRFVEEKKIVNRMKNDVNGIAKNLIY